MSVKRARRMVDEPGLDDEVVLLGRLIRRRLAEGASLSEIARACGVLGRLEVLAKRLREGPSLDAALAEIVDQIAEEVRSRGAGA